MEKGELMSKSIKFRNDTYLDTSGVSHSKETLSDILNNLISGTNPKGYHPSDMASMTNNNYSKIIDVTKTHLFHTDWLNYSSYDQRFSGVLGMFIKSSGNTSTGGVAIIFFYAGSIGINVWIDNNRWGGWKWL